MARRFGSDFRRFWAGQTVSRLGSSFIQFATPLLVYKLTHSAAILRVATAAEFVPYLLFGLVIGAWPEAPLKAPDWSGSAGTQALMIVVDLVRGGVIAATPALAAAGRLRVWKVYTVGFTSSTLTTATRSGAEPSAPRRQRAGWSERRRSPTR